MDKGYQYTEAFAELQAIVAEIERGDISIDELSQKVKRAATLIAVCKTKLTATEADVSAILETLKQTEPEAEEEMPAAEDDKEVDTETQDQVGAPPAEEEE